MAVSSLVQKYISEVKKYENIDFSAQSSQDLARLKSEFMKVKQAFQNAVEKEPYFFKGLMYFDEDRIFNSEETIYKLSFHIPEHAPDRRAMDIAFSKWEKWSENGGELPASVDETILLIDTINNSLRKAEKKPGNAVHNSAQKYTTSNFGSFEKPQQSRNFPPEFFSSPVSNLAPDALTQACKSKDINQVQNALKRGAKPDSQTLTWACFSQDIAIIQAVIDADAQPDGETLTAACATKQFKIVAQVLALGGQPGPKTLQLALQSGDQRIVNAVQRAGAQ